jgi:hypothetical protein
MVTKVENLTGEAGLQQMNLLAMTMPGRVRAYDKGRFMGKNATAKLQRAQAKRRKKGKRSYTP